MQTRLEGRVAAPLMRCASEAANQHPPEGDEAALARQVAALRLAHAFLCKGAERGLLTICEAIEGDEVL